MTGAVQADASYKSTVYREVGNLKISCPKNIFCLMPGSVGVIQGGMKVFEPQFFFHAW